MSRYSVGLDRSANDPLNIILDHIEPNSIVLEFGCSSGRMTEYLNQTMNCKVYIVECNEDDYEIAKKYAVNGICCDILQLEWLNKFKSIKFDYIIFADVLEHLSNPELALKNAASLLGEDGIIWISVPNIAHNDILLNLYDNKFQYMQTGLLDNSHIYFFTFENLEAICEAAGLKFSYIDCVNVQTNCTEQRMTETAEESDILDLLEQREFGEIYQYVAGVVLKDSKYYSDIKVENKIFNYPRYIERMIFFDMGNDFNSDYRRVRANRNQEQLNEKIDIPEGTLRIRFDPVKKIPCIINDLQIYADSEDGFEFETNADVVKQNYYFRNYDAQITITLKKPVNWIAIRGRIIYSYDILPEGKTKSKKIKKEIEEHLKTKNLLMASEENLKNEAAKAIALKAQYKKQAELGWAHRNEIVENKDKMILLLGKVEEGLKSSNQELIAEYEQLLGKYNLIENSTFWKITRPVRKVLDVLRGSNQLIENNQPSEGSSVVRTVTESEEPKAIEECLLWDYDIIEDFLELPLVSIIVPNYNHAPYLRERLETIYNQTYDNYEVILLDDCSSDNSREILDAYAEAYADATITIYSEENGGNVFRQWDKGIASAKGTLIWIAESDDYSEPNFLEEMVSLFKRKSVMLAFARSVFMQDGRRVWSTEEYLNDLPQLKWNEEFTMTAHNLVNAGWGIKNIIPNVSSTVFRNVGKFTESPSPLWEQMKLCGDWVFYLNLVKGGCVSYTNRTTNYYRVHAQSTSLNIQKTDAYYIEQSEVSKFVVQNYSVDTCMFATVQRNLMEHYKATQKASDGDAIKAYYDIDVIEKAAGKRSPNILMCLFSMSLGGGETYAIHLSNELKRQGIAVTLLDFRMGEDAQNIKVLLKDNVPLVGINSLDNLYWIFKQLGGEVVHSHHANVDGAVSDWLSGTTLTCKQVITLHGMYETLSLSDCKNLLNRVTNTCKKFVYIADKNLVPFRNADYNINSNFIKLPNGLPKYNIVPVNRKELDIKERDFVACIASRGIPEKGWQEAVEGIKIANKLSKRKIHLIILGDGEMKNLLQPQAPDYVHFMGLVSNVREYFAMSDVGILPSRFLGESYPLVIIECFFAGKPMIASDIGEVKNQMLDENGDLAGILLTLKDGLIDVNEIAQSILKLSEDSEVYHLLASRVKSARKKFDITEIAKQYFNIYSELM